MEVWRRLVRFVLPRNAKVTESAFPSPLDIKRLQNLMGFSISKPQYFIEALAHRSYVQIPGNESLISNERLEFLGDSILNFVVAEFLFNKYRFAPEGDLTKIRARLVNRKSLVAYAHKLKLDELVLLAPGTVRAGDRGMENILADSFEAMIAAIYLDGGLPPARSFVERQVALALEQGSVKVEDENFKSQLLEYSQAEGFGVPRYQIINEEGPDHDRTFTIEVYLKGEPFGVGMGKNKKDAEQGAAEKALQTLHLL